MLWIKDSEVQTPQVLAKKLGDTGCYFLCLMYTTRNIIKALGEDGNFDILHEAASAIDAGQMSDNFYVAKPSDIIHKILNEIGIFGVIIRKENADYRILPSDRHKYEILAFEKNNSGTDDHFACGDGNGKVIWDPWFADGPPSQYKLRSKRIVTIIGRI